MDRNEAAIILDRRTTIPGDGYSYEQINEAIDMAISALRMAAAENETTTQPAHINREAWEPCGACKDGKITIHVPGFRAMAVCNQHMDHEAFDLTLRLNFCPWCGRPLTPEAWSELEKRVRG